MSIDNFVSALSKLLTFKVKQFKKNYGEFSLYGDLRSAYESVSETEYNLYKKKYVELVRKELKITTFDVELIDLEADVDANAEGNVRLKFMLDVARLFDGYDEKLMFPFYTMLKVEAVFYTYTELKPLLDIGLQLTSEFDKGLLSRTEPELLENATNQLEQELTFLALTAS